MSEVLFSVFPSENFVDLCLYLFGWEQCDPSQSFGPAARNHYLFHYCISGAGTLYAENAKGESIAYQVKSGEGFMIFPVQVCTYIADNKIPWEYTWIEFDGLRAKETIELAGLDPDHPVYKARYKDIAASCGLNRSYFGKIFHQNTGKTPQEFLISYRMTKATELLKLTDLSIADIGNAVGYPNQLHFSRAFKNVYTVSPRQWRSEHGGGKQITHAR